MMQIEDLACYNQSTKNCHAKSDSQWLGNELAAALHDMINSFGLSPDYNLRELLPPKNPEIQNYDTMILGELNKAIKMLQEE